MRNNSLFIIIVASLFAMSCGEIIDIQEEANAVDFSLQTKSGSTTYRIMAYSIDALSLVATGTYFYNEGDSFLTPYKDNEGVMDRSGAITGEHGDVYISCISPVRDYNEDGSITFDPSGEFMSTQIEEVTIDGWKPVTIKEKLKDTRSKFIFNFYKAKEEEGGVSYDYTIKDDLIYLKGAGDDGSSVKYYPAVKQITFETEKTGRKCTLFQVGDSDYADVTNTLDSDLGDHVCSYKATVPAAYYAPKDTVAAKLGSSVHVKDGNYLFIQYNMLQKDREKDLNIPINLNVIKLEPMHKYVFNVVVKSNYIEVSVNIYDYSGNSTSDWYNVNDIEGVINKIDVPYNAIFSISDGGNGGWITPNLGTPSIESNLSNVN